MHGSTTPAAGSMQGSEELPNACQGLAGAVDRRVERTRLDHSLLPKKFKLTAGITAREILYKAIGAELPDLSPAM